MSTTAPEQETATEAHAFVQMELGTFEWYEITTQGAKIHNGTPQGDWLDAMEKALGYFEGSREMHLHSRLVLGDFMNFGETAYGEEYAQAIDGARAHIHLSEKSIENSMGVAKAVPIENRRPELSFSHHEAVVRLDHDNQKKFLSDAVENQWTVADLKESINLAFPKPEKPKALHKVIVDLKDGASLRLGLEKIAEGMDLLFSKEVLTDKEKGEWSGRILAVVEAFAEQDHDNLFQRLTLLCGKYLGKIEEADPVKHWTAKRKERWTTGVNEIAKAGRRGGMIGAAKPREAKTAEEGAEGTAGE